MNQEPNIDVQLNFLNYIKNHNKYKQYFKENLVAFLNNKGKYLFIVDYLKQIKNSVSLEEYLDNENHIISNIDDAIKSFDFDFENNNLIENKNFR